MTMKTQPQSAIFAEESAQYHYHHLEYALIEEASFSEFKQVLKELVTQKELSSLVVHSVLAFGYKLWGQLSPEQIPSELRDFETLRGIEQYKMPASQHDFTFWLKSANASVLIDEVMNIHQALKPFATLKNEISGFNYHDSRDLIGFVDGTGNPKEALRLQSALIPEGEIGAGGSYVLTQKWIHKLYQFKSLDISAQEKCVGRTKIEDIEFEGDEQPINSHVSRTDLKVDGVAQKIWRSSSPYATATEQGLYFLAFACELSRFDVQLQSMLGNSQDGVSDKLMQYSTPVTGAYWFAPSQQELASVLA